MYSSRSKSQRRHVPDPCDRQRLSRQNYQGEIFIEFVWKLTYFSISQIQHFMLILDVGCPFRSTSLHTAWTRQLGARSEIPSKGKSEILKI